MNGFAIERGPGGRRGFSLTELLIVIGLIAVLISLLLPVLGKARAAGQTAACLSTIRQMNTAWMVYSTESRGRFMDYNWNTPSTPNISWDGYWPGILHANGAKQSILCPSAVEVSQNPTLRGYGDAQTAWSGKFASPGTAIKLNTTTYRDGSFGFNRYLTYDGGFGQFSVVNRLSAIKRLSEVPVFFDCAYVDARPTNGSEINPVTAPPNLSGAVTLASPDHFRFLMARHGRGINVAFADGSARWTPLEETYMLSWQNEWKKYRLALPAR
jgi:prepilin-type N-terminal cleavage/methylation domain-containing protein/prepilin-type processing-associated H-X9-DG protein